MIAPISGSQVCQQWIAALLYFWLSVTQQTAPLPSLCVQMMMTKAMRERLQVGKKPVYNSATVRVRLPEGLLLQGAFNADEPVASIFNWVTDCLAEPQTTYELVGS